MKITKTTVKRINDHSSALKPSFIPAISAVGEILSQSGVILGDAGHYVINDGDEYIIPLIHSDGNREFVSGIRLGLAAPSPSALMVWTFAK